MRALPLPAQALCRVSCPVLCRDARSSRNDCLPFDAFDFFRQISNGLAEFEKRKKAGLLAPFQGFSADLPTRREGAPCVVLGLRCCAHVRRHKYTCRPHDFFGRFRPARFCNPAINQPLPKQGECPPRKANSVPHFIWGCSPLFIYLTCPLSCPPIAGFFCLLASLPPLFMSLQ